MDQPSELLDLVHCVTGEMFGRSVVLTMRRNIVLAAVLQLGLVTAPIGAGTSAAVTGAQAVEAVLWEANKRDQLDQAWVSYKRALEDPDNRKKYLGAMKVNPTLAKYAMAWGAVIERDPLAQGFMRNCDLNADTLNDRGANVEKAAKYLAAKFPEMLK